MSDFRMTGGCQCGAVRYALLAPPTNPHICHCRMCQKAFGAFFAPLAGVTLDKFEVTRGELAIFKSSDPVERGFCAIAARRSRSARSASDEMFVSIGSLDEPAKVAPKIQYGVEGRMPWFGTLDAPAGRQDHGRGRPRAITAKIARDQPPASRPRHGPLAA